MSEVTPGRVVGFRLLETLYADDVMAGIWSEPETVQAWLDVEAALARSEAAAGVIEDADGEAIAEACRVDGLDLGDLWKRSRVVGYPILPLVRMIAESLPDGPDGRVHYGATTQDIMDTGLSIQLARSTLRLAELLQLCGDALCDCVQRHAGTVMAARTHGQQAVPTTFGAKMAAFLAEVTRHLEELRRAGRGAAAVSLFGGGGTNAALGAQAAQVRHLLAERLGLATVDVPWHVARDRVARFCLICGAIAATCVRFAREVVDLSRSEIGEVAEQEGHHRGASSTMPQKANPIASEAAIGFGVTATTAATAVLRAMEAGHERSAGEWQVEWSAVPNVVCNCASALRLVGETAASLRVFPDAMLANIAHGGDLLMGEAVMMRLAPVLGRERAHDMAYEAADRAKRAGTSLVEECCALLPEDARAAVGDLNVTPQEYLGEADHICQVAVRDWHEVRDGPNE